MLYIFICIYIYMLCNIYIYIIVHLYNIYIHTHDSYDDYVDHHLQSHRSVASVTVTISPLTGAT